MDKKTKDVLMNIAAEMLTKSWKRAAKLMRQKINLRSSKTLTR